MQQEIKSSESRISNRSLIESYLQQLQELEYGTPWIDETFQKKLKPVTEENAFIRPQPEVHSVAELISHLVVWRQVIIDVIKGKPYVSASDSRNWKSNDLLRSEGWKPLLQRFYDSRKEIESLLSDKNDAWLGKVYNGSHKMKYLMDGLVQHDAYHLGQLGIAVKLLKV